MNDSLIAAKVSRVQRELPLLINELDSLVPHLGFMTSSAASWKTQPRELRRQLDELTRRATALHARTVSILRDADEVVAAAPSGPPGFAQRGRRPPPFVDVASIRVQGRRLDGLHARMRPAIVALRQKVRELETAPGLYGQEPDSGLEVILNILTLVKDVAARWR